MEEDYRRALEPSFTYGCGRCAFKHNISGDQLEVLDYIPNSPNFLSLECLASRAGNLSPTLFYFTYNSKP